MTVLAPFLSLVLCTLVAVTPGDDLDPEAKEHFERGLVDYNDKQYATAIKELRVAYALDPRPVILFAWAQAERLYGRCSRASKLYQRFLKSRPSKQQADAARLGLERCKDQPDTATEEPEDEPEPKAIEPAPAPVEAPSPTPPPPPPRRKVDGVGIGLASAGVVLASVGAGLLGAGQSRARDASDGPTNYGAYVDEATSVRRLRISGGVLAGIGGALLIGGVVKLVLHARQPRRDVSFWADPVGAGVLLRTRF
jgi:hypothetical protein